MVFTKDCFTGNGQEQSEVVKNSRSFEVFSNFETHLIDLKSLG